MTITQALQKASKELAHLPSPELEVRLILAHILKKPQTWLFSNEPHQLTLGQSSKYFTLIKQRNNRVPLAYITHKKEFWGLSFYVDRNVLIPRPETETLVAEAINYISYSLCFPRSSQLKTSPLTIADIGTGSGCIMISLAHHLKEAASCKLLANSCKLYATDISPAALNIARKNAKTLLGPHHNITFLRGNLLEPLPEKVDLILANLPYLSENEYLETEQEVKKEPRQALIGGPTGNELIKKLLKQARKHLKPGGKVIYETTGGKVREQQYS